MTNKIDQVRARIEDSKSDFDERRRIAEIVERPLNITELSIVKEVVDAFATPIKSVCAHSSGKNIEAMVQAAAEAEANRKNEQLKILQTAMPEIQDLLRMLAEAGFSASVLAELRERLLRIGMKQIYIKKGERFREELEGFLSIQKEQLELRSKCDALRKKAEAVEYGSNVAKMQLKGLCGSWAAQLREAISVYEQIFSERRLALPPFFTKYVKFAEELEQEAASITIPPGFRLEEVNKRIYT